MKNIEKINPFRSSHKQTSFGLITTLQVESGITVKDVISFEDKTLLATDIDEEFDPYSVVYTIMDTEGETQSFVKDDGILPTLFFSPNQTIFVTVQPYDPDRDFEISIPLFDRDDTEQPKGNRPFAGDCVGVYKKFAVLHDNWSNSWDDNKPDKIQFIEFKDDNIKKKHNKKIPLPKNNHVYISNDEIHLLAHTAKGWLHRLIDEKANIIKERLIDAVEQYFWQILTLSFDNDSYVVSQEDGKVLIRVISPDGKLTDIDLIDIKDTFYNVWQPVEISDNTFVMQFNTEFGNGWFTIKDNQLVEFFYGKETNGYKNLLTGEVMEMESDRLVINSINKTKDNSYAVVFYPMTDTGVKNKDLIVLNRKIDC